MKQKWNKKMKYTKTEIKEITTNDAKIEGKRGEMIKQRKHNKCN